MEHVCWNMLLEHEFRVGSKTVLRSMDVDFFPWNMEPAMEPKIARIGRPHRTALRTISGLHPCSSVGAPKYVRREVTLKNSTECLKGLIAPTANLFLTL